MKKVSNVMRNNSISRGNPVGPVCRISGPRHPNEQIFVHGERHPDVRIFGSFAGSSSAGVDLQMQNK